MCAVLFVLRSRLWVRVSELKNNKLYLSIYTLNTQSINFLVRDFRVMLQFDIKRVHRTYCKSGKFEIKQNTVINILCIKLPFKDSAIVENTEDFNLEYYTHVYRPTIYTNWNKDY